MYQYFPCTGEWTGVLIAQFHLAPGLWVSNIHCDTAAAIDEGIFTNSLYINKAYKKGSQTTYLGTKQKSETVKLKGGGAALHAAELRARTHLP